MVSIDWSATGTMIAAVVSILAVIWQYFVVISSLKKEQTDATAALRAEAVSANKGIVDQITNLATSLRAEAVECNKEVMDLLIVQGNRLTTMETKMELFWNAVGGVMSSLIKQPIHFRKDKLMDKLVLENLPLLPEASIEELLELKMILKDELVTLREIKDPKSLAYALALAYIDQILLDKGLVRGECK